MEPLKKQLDFKLVFDVLCEPNGMISLNRLSEHWPSNSESGADRLERSSMQHWTRAANQAGYLSWESFCAGVRGAIVAETESDEMELEKTRGLDASKPDTFYVPTERMEATLSRCERSKLLEALTRSRKEAYNQQQALQMLSNPPGNERTHSQARLAGTPQSGTHRAGGVSRSSSFSGHRTSVSSPASNELATANPGVSASLTVLAEVENMLKNKLALPPQCSAKVPLLWEAVQQLRTLVQSLESGPEQSRANPMHPRKERVAATTRPASMLIPSTNTHPTVILPSKPEPYNRGAMGSNPHSFSPKKGVHPPNQPMRVDRSISYSAAPTRSPSPLKDPVNRSPSAIQEPGMVDSMVTGYPRMRAAHSLSSLPTNQEPSPSPNPTRNILEQWKNSQLVQSATHGSGALQGMPSSRRPLTPDLHKRPGATQPPQAPSHHPQAMVEVPSSTPRNQHHLSSSKHFGQQYLSSPNLLGSPTEEALQKQQYGTIRRGNRNLSQVVSEQSAQIHRLQSEKEALIRHLFHQQAQGQSSADDSVMSVL